MARVLLLILGLFGHVVIWVVAYNRFTARSFPRHVLKIGEMMIALGMVLLPLLIALNYDFKSAAPPLTGQVLADTYIAACAAFACMWLPRWLVEWWSNKHLAIPMSSRHEKLQNADQEPLVQGWLASIFSRMPGNQILSAEINEKEISIANLDPALDGLTIAHFSDLHFSGRMTASFYRQIIEKVSALRADMIAITGDFLDKPQCLDWIQPLFRKLGAPCGVYFVLGNHDKKVGLPGEIREQLTAAGLVSLGGRSLVKRIRNCDVLLAGNERPWIGSVPTDLPSGCLRIALLHTPDQFLWARGEQFDLVLAGHTHGGQVRIPRLGAIFCPSRFGTRYACGVFFDEPSTMHVTRGVSGFYPLRLGCPPEITKLVLRRSG